METITTATNTVTFKGIIFTRLFNNFWAATMEKVGVEFYETLFLKDGFIRIYPNKNNSYNFTYYSKLKGDKI